jgi:eukaryotic-like serine/threonine-protein kinase
MAYAPDGLSLASGGDDGTVRIWDTRTGQQQHQLTGHTGPVTAVAYAPDGLTLASSGRRPRPRGADLGASSRLL